MCVYVCQFTTIAKGSRHVFFFNLTHYTRTLFMGFAVVFVTII